ncbi:hypothetical protein H0H81_010658 [Sphagnurus paluster]|uniref:Uncharacterized protein n=1 Tax=Sphagnurus paluster TaxID=117069 RepID=A0A9P7FP05_9AGAR|nr:hypothetical protein H0H81_010658 [Sphagnurus paluster]
MRFSASAALIFILMSLVASSMSATVAKIMDDIAAISETLNTLQAFVAAPLKDGPNMSDLEVLTSAQFIISTLDEQIADTNIDIQAVDPKTVSLADRANLVFKITLLRSRIHEIVIDAKLRAGARNNKVKDLLNQRFALLDAVISNIVAIPRGSQLW